MTSRISLITAVGGAALMLAVPAAWGKGQLGSSTGASPDVFERAVAAQQRDVSTPIVYSDALDRAAALRQRDVSTPIVYSDGLDRAVAAKLALQSQGTGSSRVFFDDPRERIDPGTLPVIVSATDTGRTIEWPQIGAGFGVGIVLAFGLLVAMRHSRGRPLAHG